LDEYLSIDELVALAENMNNSRSHFARLVDWRSELFFARINHVLANTDFVKDFMVSSAVEVVTCFALQLAVHDNKSYTLCASLLVLLPVQYGTRIWLIQSVHRPVYGKFDSTGTRYRCNTWLQLLPRLSICSNDDGLYNGAI
jgi:hypothetical protein